MFCYCCCWKGITDFSSNPIKHSSKIIGGDEFACLYFAQLVGVGSCKFRCFFLALFFPPCVLDFAASKAKYFPAFSSISSSKGKQLEAQFAAMIVTCLERRCP